MQLNCVSDLTSVLQCSLLTLVRVPQKYSTSWASGALCYLKWIGGLEGWVITLWTITTITALTVLIKITKGSMESARFHKLKPSLTQLVLHGPLKPIELPLTPNIPLSPLPTWQFILMGSSGHHWPNGFDKTLEPSFLAPWTPLASWTLQTPVTKLMTCFKLKQGI